MLASYGAHHHRGLSFEKWSAVSELWFSKEPISLPIRGLSFLQHPQGLLRSILKADGKGINPGLIWQLVFKKLT